MSRPSAGGRPAKRKSRPTPKRKSAASSSTQRSAAHVSGAPAGRQNTGGGKLWFYGRHAVEAALKNPRRTCHQLLATDEALSRLAPQAKGRAPEIRRVDRTELDEKLGGHAVHQGLALAVAPLPAFALDRLAGLPDRKDSMAADAEHAADIVLVLDRVNDPHNLGAILRSAVAFNARAVIVPHRQSAELGGATAKAASGALDMLPVIEVTNLARSLEALKEMGYWRAGLDGRAEQRLDQAPAFDRLALVLGAEGAGIRRLVADHCDLMLKLPISDEMESLNVSVACGIALYALTRGA